MFVVVVYVYVVVVVFGVVIIVKVVNVVVVVVVVVVVAVVVVFLIVVVVVAVDVAVVVVVVVFVVVVVVVVAVVELWLLVQLLLYSAVGLLITMPQPYFAWEVDFGGACPVCGRPCENKIMFVVLKTKLLVVYFHGFSSCTRSVPSLFLI